MSDHAVSAGIRGRWSMPVWGPAVLLLVCTALVGPHLGSVVRPLFVLACGGVGWLAWRRDPAGHLQVILLLLAFAPFVRRLVDLSAGYDSGSLMLVGPLLAVLAPVVDLRCLLDGALTPTRQSAPLMIVAGCIAYGTGLSLFQGDWTNAASGSLKWLAPLLYASVLQQRRERHDRLLRAATRAFLVILPLIGTYGIVQYVDPPDWDRYWLSFAPITSAGFPVPYGVRTFSTMNGPASFATFTATGLLFVCFLRPAWWSLLLAAPAALSLLLSSYRTAWLSLAFGIAFCLLFAVTRRRAAGMVLAIAVAITLAGTLTPFGDMISDRLATFNQGAQDGSAQERLEEYATLWTQPDSQLVGEGFSTVDVGSAGVMPIDGTIVGCWVAMGIVVGLICLFGLVWAIINAISASMHDRQRESVLVGALAVGALTQIPLASITSGELGFLFWAFVVLLPPPATAFETTGR